MTDRAKDRLEGIAEDIYRTCISVDGIRLYLERVYQLGRADENEACAMECRAEYGADMDQAWVDCAAFLEDRIRSHVSGDRNGEGK